jgi:hypothetical protein
MRPSDEGNAAPISGPEAQSKQSAPEASERRKKRAQRLPVWALSGWA